MPNVFVTLAHRPDEFRAFFAYHDALMDKEGGLTKAEREMIVVATSGANDCLYCIVAHGAILRIYAKNPLRGRPGGHQLSQGRHHAAPEGDAGVRAEGGAAQQRDRRRRFRRRCGPHGFSDEDAWDIGAIAAFFALSNRMANLIGMRPNDEFFVLGRVPRVK